MANALTRNIKDWFQEEGGTRMPIGRRAAEELPASYFRPLSNFFWDMDRVFDQTLRNFGFPAITPGVFGFQPFRPNVDIASNDNAYTITVEVPGLEEKDIHLDVSASGELTVRGEKKQESTESRQDVVCSECSYGAFQRTLTLPEDADQESIEARFRNGVLTITCPRKESDRAQSRHIPIEGGRKGEGARERGSERGAERGQERGQERSISQGSKKAA